MIVTRYLGEARTRHDEWATLSGEHFHRCDACGKRNRIPAAVGVRGIRCGGCGHALPTPKILERLSRVKTELQDLSVRLRRFDYPRNHTEIEGKLRRQKAILANLPDLPGYRLTSHASFDLIIEIGVLVDELEHRLQRTALKVALRILVEIGQFLRILAVETPRLLTSGSDD